MKRAFFTFAILVLAPVSAWCGQLPQTLAPPAPFPRILQQAPTIEEIAPGIEYGDYSLRTEKGPIAVRVVAIQANRHDVRVSEVQAQNALESRGETVGSMAKRTGAVAGINGDYFDIGNSNRPLNIVVRDGALLQMPSKRYALAITKDGVPQIGEFTFSGQVEIGGGTFALGGINQLPPPNGGTALLTPQFGSVPPQDDVTLVALQPLDTAPPTRYRVASLADTLTTQPPGYYLVIGLNSSGSIETPSEGDLVSITGDLSPIGLASIATAIGGGPLILHAGSWYDDPDGPRGGEYERSIPSSGAAIAPGSTLLLIEVDGRQPSRSVGLTRHEFSALMRAFGATEGMSFDGGGSSTIVARRLGDTAAEVVNKPSDGKERTVGNGIFAYSTDPVGPPVRLIAQPGVIRAVAGAQVRVRVAALDAASHVADVPSGPSASVEPPSLGTFRNGEFTALHAGNGRVRLRNGALKGAIALEIQAKPERIEIEPLQPNVDVNGTLALSARAFDRYGYALELPPLLRWSANAGSIDAFGHFRAGSNNADVTLRVGDAAATVRVTVGSHQTGIGFAQRARFMTIPRGGEGGVARDPQCADCVRLTYAFSGNERAAYAAADVPLPAGTIGVAFDVLDDGSGARLRVAVRNAINESVLLDATHLDQPGWRHVVVRFPAGIEATKFIALYVLAPQGMQLSNGEIVLRNVNAVVAGK